MEGTTPQQLIFKSAYNTVLDVRQLSKPLEVEADGITITLRYPKEGEQGFGAKDGTAICIATVIKHPDPEVSGAFADIAEHRIPEGSVVQDNDRDMVTPDGKVKDNYAIHFRWLPERLRQYITEVQTQLLNAVRRAVGIARWRLGIPTGHNPIKSVRGQEWSNDGETWYHTPTDFEIQAWSLSPHFYPPDFLEDVGRLIANDAVSEPLGHELFREAWDQRYSNPRSALILGMSSAEARVKEFISLLEPGAAWFLDNFTAPPLPAILKNYIPALLVRRGIRAEVRRPPSETIMSPIDNGMQLRNKVAHGVRKEVRLDEVEAFLPAVRDVNCMLDVFSGYAWARFYVRPEVLERWDPQGS